MQIKLYILAEFSHCLDKDHNYCDINADCYTNLGSSSCTCRQGFDDVSLDVKSTPGEWCVGKWLSFLEKFTLVACKSRSVAKDLSFFYILLPLQPITLQNITSLATFHTSEQNYFPFILWEMWACYISKWQNIIRAFKKEIWIGRASSVYIMVGSS